MRSRSSRNDLNVLDIFRGTVMHIEMVTIFGRIRINERNEPKEKVTFSMGNIISIADPTGCGEITQINDIEMDNGGIYGLSRLS